jgi:hypothetical protein
MHTADGIANVFCWLAFWTSCLQMAESAAGHVYSREWEVHASLPESSLRAAAAAAFCRT